MNLIFKNLNNQKLKKATFVLLPLILIIGNIFFFFFISRPDATASPDVMTTNFDATTSNATTIPETAPTSGTTTTKETKVIFQEARQWQIAADAPDVLNLRPNAAGDVTGLAVVGATANWDAVDEDPSDDDTTYVGNTAKGTTAYDLYNLPDPNVVGTINSVTVSINVKAAAKTGSAKTVIKTEGSEFRGDSYILPTTYTVTSTTYTTNPSTTVAWTWAQINALQAGVELTADNKATVDVRCTQVWAAVDYIPLITLTQNYYRWRDDSTALNTDGGWLAAENTAWATTTKNTITRLRVEIANTGTAQATGTQYLLEYAATTSGPWYAVPTTTASTPFVMVDSSQYADGASTTVSFLTAVGTFATGTAVEYPSNKTTAFDLINNYYTEFEYAIKTTDYAPDSGTYYFRLTNNGTTTNFTYDIYPTLTLNLPRELTQYKSDHSTVIPVGGSTVSTTVYLDFDAGGNTLSDSFTPKVEVRDTSTSFTDAVTHTGNDVQFDAEDPDDVRGTCIVYDDLNDQLVMWGGYMGSSTKANTNDTWVLSLKEKQRSQWKNLTTSGTKPQANRAHVCAYDSLNDRLVVYGGWDGTTYLTSAWALTLPSSGTPTWSQLAVSGSPPSSGQQLQACAVYDTSPSRMIVYGGYSGSDVDTDVVYQLTLPSSGTSTWSDLGLTTGPSATGQGRDVASCVYDTDSDRMVMYGGHIDATTNAVWSLNLAAGSEAWTQISPTGDAGLRQGHAAAFQPDYTGTDDRMIIFGGWNSTDTYKSDVWQLTLPESGGSVWTDKTPSGTSKPQARAYGGPNGVYDPFAQRALFIGGYDGTYYTNEVVAFDLPTSGSFEYKVINDIRYLRDRDASGMIFDSSNNQMIIFGGAGRGLPTYAYNVSETWKLNTSGTPVWKDAGSDMGPIQREIPSMVYDSLNNRAVSCFGLTINTVLNDCWQLSLPSSGRSKWTNLSPSGTLPTARWAATHIYDDLNDRMVTFGGKDQSVKELNDTQFLSLPSGGAATSWQTVTVDGTPPSVRWGAVAIYDPDRDRMIVFGGVNEGATDIYYNDVYPLTLPASGNPTWGSVLSCGTAPAARRGHVAVWQKDYSVNDDRMIVFGGYDGTNHYNDVWQLAFPDAGGCTWTQLSPTGSLPSQRRSIAANYDSVNDRMIIFGGRNADQFFGDTWALSLGASPAWTNLDPQVMVPVSVAVTSLTSGTSYHWQAWYTGSVSGDSSKAPFGDNSDSPLPADVDFSITGVGITISGTVYTDEGVNTSSDGWTVSLVVNGSWTASTTAATTSGAYSFSNVTSTAGVVFHVYLDNSAGKGVTVTWSAGANISGLNIYQNRIIARHDDSGPITISDLDKYDNEQDTDVLFTATTSPSVALSVDANAMLYIWPEKTFAPGGNITIDPGGTGDWWDGSLKLTASSTFTATGTESHSIGGSWFASSTATFTAASSTITFTATTTGKTITTAGNSFYNLTFNGSGGVWTFQDNATTTNDLTTTAGTASSTYNMVVQGGNITGTNGSINFTGGTTTLSGSGNLGPTGTGTYTFYNLTLSGSAATTTLAGTITVSNDLSIGADRTLALNNKNLTVKGGDIITTTTGSITCSGCTAGVVNLYGTGTLGGGTGSITFYNFALQHDSTSTQATTTLGTAITALNDIIIGKNRILDVSASNYGITVGGSWSILGTFTRRQGTVTFNSTSTGKVITGKYGNALSFDGVDDHVDAPIPDLVDYTYEVWFYTKSFTNGGAADGGGTYFVDRQVGGSPLASLKAVDGKFAHQYRDNGGAGLGAISGEAIKLNIWQHVVWGRKKGVEFFIYVDTIKNSITDTLGSLTPDDPRIGCHQAIMGAHNGLIDEVRIYNRALTSTEVSEHYQGIFKNESGLVGLWHFDEGTETTAKDNSGYGNNGTLLPTGSEPTWIDSGAPPSGYGYPEFYNITFNGTGGSWLYKDGSTTAPNQTTVSNGTPTYLNAKTGAVSVTGGTLNVDWYLGVHVVDKDDTNHNIDTKPDADPYAITISENSTPSSSTVWRYNGGWGSPATSTKTDTNATGKNPQPNNNLAIRIREYSKNNTTTTFYKYNLEITVQSGFGAYDYLDYGNYITSVSSTESTTTKCISQDWYRSDISQMNTYPTVNNPPTTGSWYVGMASTLEFSVSATSTDLGSLYSGNDWTAIGTTTLSVTTTAYNGYLVKAYADNLGRLRLGATENYIDRWIRAGATNATPTSWDINCSTSTDYCGFGYTTDDDTLEGGTLNRFTDYNFCSATTSNKCWAGFATSSASTDPIADATSSVSGAQTTITYKVSADQNKTAGTYSTKIYYICTANY